MILNLGRQLVDNALFSIFWSIVKKVSVWKYFDLDNILFQGDSIYKSLDTENYLNVDELPRQFHYGPHNIEVLIKNHDLHDGIIVVGGEHFIQNIFEQC